jgi:PAS domain S-box-containing protein
LRLLTDELSEKVEDLRDANARLRALINIGLDLASARSSDRMLQSVCDAACDLFGGTYASVGIVDRDDITVRRLAMCGVASDDWISAGDVVPGILRTVVTERRLMRGDNPGGRPSSLRLPAGHDDVQTFLAAPIASRAHVYGWIFLACNEGRPFSARDEPVLMALAGQVGRIYELEYEILERKQAEAALRHERDRVAFALEATGVGIWEMDVAANVVRWSEILESQYGLAAGAFAGTFEAFLGHIHPDDRAALLGTVQHAMTSGADFAVQHRAIRPDGMVRWLSGAGRFQLDEHGRAVRGVGISQDVTERRALEEARQQGQKMEAVGRLAGGVAHDLNNLLTVILGCCELIQTDPDGHDLHRADLSEIQKAGTRAAGLTRQLLAFSRKQIIEPAWLDLNQVVTGLQPMLERLIREDVTIVFRLEPGALGVTADRGQAEQIILNLAVNARDAMPGGGTLIIETAVVALDEHYVARHTTVPPGPYVVLTVTDTGTGIPPQVLAHVFEPFFTTKELGQGTGLGLATVHGIVARSGGSVNVYSEIGLGTSFKVYLPKVEALNIPAAAPLPVVPPHTGAETILVVEDAAELREVTKRLLERLGYTVLIAANAAEAVQVFDRSGGIDLLLTDVVMPGASGPELTEQLTARRPSLKVVFMSGYTEATIVHDGILNPGITFLHKPFTSETLGRKVRDALDRLPAPPASRDPLGSLVG